MKWYFKRLIEGGKKRTTFFFTHLQQTLIVSKNAIKLREYFGNIWEAVRRNNFKKKCRHRESSSTLERWGEKYLSKKEN